MIPHIYSCKYVSLCEPIEEYKYDHFCVNFFTAVTMINARAYRSTVLSCCE